MRKTTAEVVVAVVSNTGDLTIEDWSQQTFESLGIGKKDKGNGLLLVIATAQHEARLNTGYGLEGVLPDITCSRILRGLVNLKMAQGKRVVIFRHEKTAESIDILRLVLILSCVGRRVSGTLSGAGGD